jgi:hypothetical protein
MQAPPRRKRLAMFCPLAEDRIPRIPIANPIKASVGLLLCTATLAEQVICQPGKAEIRGRFDVN